MYYKRKRRLILWWNVVSRTRIDIFIFKDHLNPSQQELAWGLERKAFKEHMLLNLK